MQEKHGLLCVYIRKGLLCIKCLEEKRMKKIKFCEYCGQNITKYPMDHGGYIEFHTCVEYPEPPIPQPKR